MPDDLHGRWFDHCLCFLFRQNIDYIRDLRIYSEVISRVDLWVMDVDRVHRLYHHRVRDKFAMVVVEQMIVCCIQRPKFCHIPDRMVDEQVQYEVRDVYHPMCQYLQTYFLFSLALDRSI